MNAELREIAREHGLPVTTRLTHDELVRLLTGAGVGLPPSRCGEHRLREAVPEPRLAGSAAAGRPVGIAGSIQDLRASSGLEPWHSPLYRLLPRRAQTRV
jgi:hypothetical protein